MAERGYIIKLARERGLIVTGKPASDDWLAHVRDLVAKKVAAEREACAKLCDQYAALMRDGKGSDELTNKLFDLQAKTGDDLAAIIRARKNGGM